MQDIEPYDNWNYLYDSETDERSPFYGREYNKFEFTNTIYNYYIHPLWDEFGSSTLYLKVLMADYDEQYAIIEMIGKKEIAGRISCNFPSAKFSVRPY